MSSVRAIRGATQLESDDREHLFARTAELVRAVLSENQITSESLISMFFTCTPDLTSDFPAAAARELGLGDVPLMCSVEIDVDGALPRVVRLMAHANIDRPRSEIRHVYHYGAKTLRKDLAQ